MLKLLRFIEAHLELYINESASTFKQLHVINIEQVLKEQIAKKSNHELIRAKALEITTQVYILRGGSQIEWAQEILGIVQNNEGIIKMKAI